MNYAEQNRNPTRHIVGIGIVVILHVFLIYGLINGLGSTIVDIIKAPVETKIIKDETKPPPPPPPPPPPEVPVTAPPPFIPPPEIQVQPPPEQTHVIQAVQHAAPAPYVPTKPAPVAAPQVTGPSSGPVSTGGSKPDFPEQYLEEGREGHVVVTCDIEADGRPTGCTLGNVTGGSGFGSAVLNWLRSGRVKYRPAMANGQPVRSAGHVTSLTFKLSGGD